MKVGILGAGNIAAVLARTMNQMEEVNLYAVASRDLARSQEFAQKYNVEKAYGSYEELLDDEDVELVYIATPHSHHYEHMKMCILKHKAVLCEKAFTMNASQAREIKALAAKEKVYVTEAIWTRYMPSRALINEVINSGIVGEVSTVSANLSYDIDEVRRIMEPELAGGALLDIGVYGLNFLLMHMGKDIERITSAVQMTATGVDGMETINIFFKDKKMGVTTHSIYARSDRKGIFYGERGYIIVENINNPQSIDVFDAGDNLIKHIDVPAQISGYEYQIRESIKAIEEGRLESESMPLDESIFVMEIMDSIRKDWGMSYPQEQA